MRDGSFCALLVAAAEPSNTERTVPSVCDSHGGDFGSLSHVVLTKICKKFVLLRMLSYLCNRKQVNNKSNIYKIKDYEADVPL